MDRWSLRSWRAHLALAVPAAIWFAPQLFFQRVGYFRDTGLYFQPHKALIAEALRAGRLPQWNPFEYGGMPLLADPNFNTFHPLSLLTDLLPLPWGFGVFLFTCALLGAYGARALGRTLGLRHAGALACGLFFAWSGPTVSFLLTGQAVASCALPWLCAAGANLGRKRTLGAFLLCALASASQLLSGTPEIGACGFALAGLLAISESLAHASEPGGESPTRSSGVSPTRSSGMSPSRSSSESPSRSSGARAVAASAMFLLAAFLGAGLSAIQLVPSAHFLLASSRASGFSSAAGLTFSLDPLRLWEILFPFFSGDIDGPGASSWLLPLQEQPYVEQIYLGLWVCALALAGLRGGAVRRRWPLLAGAALFAMLTFGNHFAAIAFLWRHLPLLQSVRFPEKLIVPLSLAVAVSAGAGWERLSAWASQLGSGVSSPVGSADSPPPFNPAREKRRFLFVLLGAMGLLAAALFASWPELWLHLSGPRWPEARVASLASSALPSIALEALLGAGGLAFAALLLRGKIRPSLAISGFAALLFAELASPGLRLNRTAPLRDWLEPSPLAALLQADARAPLTAFRISSQSTGLSTARLDAIAAEDGPTRSLALDRLRRTALFDASVVRAGVRSDRGYSGFTPGGLKRLYTESPDGAGLDLLGVRYGIEFGGGPSGYLALGFTPRPDLSAAAIAASPSLAKADLRVYENPRAMPGAWLAPAVLTHSDSPAPRCGGQLVPWLDEKDLRALPADIPRAGDCAALPPAKLASARISSSSVVPPPVVSSSTAPPTAASPNAVSPSVASLAPAPRDEASLLSFAPEQLVLQTDAAAPSLLVLAESGLPGWRAFVDGAETPVLVADGALRACAVPAGRHQISFVYAAPGLGAGALATALSLALLAILSVLARRRSREI